jgi:hypothetical protein
MNAFLFALAATIASAVWLSAVAPALAQSGQECRAYDPGTCIVQRKGTFPIYSFGTVDWTFYCSDPHYPYVQYGAWSYDQRDKDGPRKSVTAIPDIETTDPTGLKLLMTNWWYPEVDVTVWLGCTQSTNIGQTCGSPVGDPHCPIVQGSTHNYCGPLGFCFQSYEQLCQPENVHYRCTASSGLVWCQRCPG